MSCIFIVTVYFQVNENVTVLVPFQLTEVHDQTISEVSAISSQYMTSLSRLLKKSVLVENHILSVYDLHLF